MAIVLPFLYAVIMWSQGSDYIKSAQEEHHRKKTFAGGMMRSYFVKYGFEKIKDGIGLKAKNYINFFALG